MTSSAAFRQARTTRHTTTPCRPRVSQPASRAGEPRLSCLMALSKKVVRATSAQVFERGKRDSDRSGLVGIPSSPHSRPDAVILSEKDSIPADRMISYPDWPQKCIHSDSACQTFGQGRLRYFRCWSLELSSRYGRYRAGELDATS